MGQQCSVFAGTTFFLWGENKHTQEVTVFSVRNQFICGVGYIRSCKAIKTSKIKDNYSGKNITWPTESRLD